MHNRPLDHQQRERALDPTCSFICEAPAGSGKTELLTQRVLTLLAGVSQPEAIMAITFTRKAAAEMRGRILAALQRGQGERPTEEHALVTWQLARAALQRDRLLNWGLLQNPSRLQIRTFDSLCAFLTQNLPLKASLGVNIGPADNAEPLYERAVRDFLATIEQDVPWKTALLNVLRHLDNNHLRLSSLLVTMLKSREGWIPVVRQSKSHHEVREVLEGYLREVIVDKVTRLNNLLSPPNLSVEDAGEFFELAGFAAANLQRENATHVLCDLLSLEIQKSWPATGAQSLRQWLAVKQLLLTQAGSFRVKLDKRCGFPSAGTKEEKQIFKAKKERMLVLIGKLQNIPGLLDQLRSVDHWPDERYNGTQWPILESLLELLPVLLAHLRLIFAQFRQVDFTEMSERAREALGEEQAPTDLALRLDQRIEHILVDEFQDTSFGQVDLLARLTAGWQPNDGRTLFCVGDAMQSIYGFRGAKVGLFLHCQQHGLADVPLEPLKLTANFRSQGALVNWINDTFVKAFPLQNDIAAGAVAFSRADDFRAALSGAAASVHVCEARAQSSVEEQRMVQLILDIWRDDPQAQVAILVRNRGHAETAVLACQRAGIKFRAVDLIPLTERQAVQDVLTLCKALLNPMDRVAWFALLRAPWCGLTLDDLLCLSPENGFSEVLPLIDVMQRLMGGAEGLRYVLSRDGVQRLTRVTQVLRASLHNRERLPLRQWVEGTWLALGGADCLTEAADTENVQRVWQMLSELSRDGHLPEVSELDKALAELFAAPDPNADERLQIMTIHKSKGLEFDAVIVPELHRQPRNSDSELLIWSERVGLGGQEQWILAPVHATGHEKDAIYHFVQQERKQRERYEACRLLYVACTRAKKRLHLFARLKMTEGGDWMPPPEGSLLNYIWPSVKHGVIDYARSHDEPAQGWETTAVRSLRRLPTTWPGPALTESHLLDDFLISAQYDNTSVREWLLVSENLSVERIVGSFVHEILQDWVERERAGRGAGKRFEEKVSAWRQRLYAMGLNESEASNCLPDVVNGVRRAVSHGQYQTLLTRAQRCFCEYGVSLMKADTVQHFVVDLLCDMGQGQAVIVDYKTSRPARGQGRQDFVRHEESLYTEILRHYSSAVKGLGYKSVKVVLFFVMIGEWHELVL